METICDGCASVLDTEELDCCECGWEACSECVGRCMDEHRQEQADD
jgi:hypothetical protein